MKALLISVAAILFFSGTLFSQAGDDYSSTLKKMFQVSGSEESFKAVLSQMTQMLKEQNPDLGNEFWDEFEAEFKKTSLDDLVVMLIPVYTKYMTQEDLEALITFYQSPVGVKYAQNSPMIMQESMQIGQVWGAKIGENFDKKIRDKEK